MPWFPVDNMQENEQLCVVGGKIQLQKTAVTAAAVDADVARVVVGVVAAAVAAACLGSAGTLPVRDASLPQRNPVQSVYKSRNTKNPSPGGAFQSEVIGVSDNDVEAADLAILEDPNATAQLPRRQQGRISTPNPFSLVPRTQSPFSLGGFAVSCNASQA